jgi:hypothetical protein
MHISANGQIMIEFPSKPPSHLYHAALVHPLKKAEFFDDFHRKVRTHLRPVLQRVTKCEGMRAIQTGVWPIRTVFWIEVGPTLLYFFSFFP